MKKLLLISALSFLVLGVIGCNRNKVDVQSLKPVTTRTVSDLSIVLLSSTGDLSQGQNDFVIQFRNQQGQPVDVGDVQLGSSMTMPSMAPMSGASEITPTGQTGTYRVKSNFAMSGAWHFTIDWSGPHGQGKTTFNSNVR
jgi:YtkA-like